MDTKERGMTAASAYLDRIGMDVVDVGANRIIALDEYILVHVEVLTAADREELEELTASMRSLSTRIVELAEYKEANGLTSDTRFDVVTIFQIADDRALLRHHRDVRGDELP